jgi:hypothetical protein
VWPTLAYPTNTAGRALLNIRLQIIDVSDAGSPTIHYSNDAEQDLSGQPNYQSLFELYPLLRSRPRPLSFTPTDSVNYSYSDDSTSPISLPDLKPLKRATASKILNPEHRLCKFEVPGGGVCRDATCEDVHPSRMFKDDLGPSGTLYYF